jgi:hypothetical protein
MMKLKSLVSYSESTIMLVMPLKKEKITERVSWSDNAPDSHSGGARLESSAGYQLP